MQRLWHWSIVGLVALILTGCPTPSNNGGGGAGAGGGTGTGGGAASGGSDLTNLPDWTTKGNTYFFPTSANPPTLDPAQVSDTTSDAICAQIFDGLLSQDDKLNVASDIATEWKVDPDNVTYHFTLTDKAKFHNGRSVVADDFVYSYTRLLEPEVAAKRANWVYPILGAKEYSAWKALANMTQLPPTTPVADMAKAASAKLGGLTGDALKAAQDNINLVKTLPAPVTKVAGLIADDATHLTIKLAAPYAPFLYVLTTTSFSVVPKEEVAKYKVDEFTLHPVGSGAFKFVDWKENQYVVLQANKDYWKKSPALDGIVYRVIKEPRQQLEEYKLGHLNHCMVDPVNVFPVVDQDPVLKEQVHTYPLLSLGYFGFNMEKPPFGVDPKQRNNPDVVNKARLLRQAVAYAVDRQYICHDIMKDEGIPYNKIIPPGLGSYTNPPDTPAYDYEPEKTAELLKEAGYPNGQGLPSLTMWFNKEGSNPDIAAAIQGDLKKAGINTDVKVTEWASYLEAVDAGEPPFFRLGWVQDYPDPDNWLWVLFDSHNKGPLGNESRYDNPEVDKLLEQAQTIADMSQRIPLYQQAEKIILDDCPWMIYEHGVNKLLVKPEVQGMTFTPVDSADTINHVRFEDISLKH